MPDLVPKKVKNHPSYPYIQHALRIFQFVFAVVNIGLFASYIARTAVRLSSSSGAVTGILAAAAAFSIVATVVKCTKLSESKRVIVAITVLDILFIGAFIAVSVLTSLDRSRGAGQPGSGSKCAAGEDNDNDNNNNNNNNGNMEDTDGMSNCGLTSASMGLAIVSTILHTASAALQQQGGKMTSHAGKIENPLKG